MPTKVYVAILFVFFFQKWVAAIPNVFLWENCLQSNTHGTGQHIDNVIPLHFGHAVMHYTMQNKVEYSYKN